MSEKIIVAVMFGGKSAEHEISLISAQNIIRALDRNKFEPLLIGVDKNGHWFLQDEAVFLAIEANPKTISLPDHSRQIALLPGENAPHFLDLSSGNHLPEPTAVFSILHGPYGEDGTMQGLFRQIDMPFVGPDVTGSSVAMDKDVAKRLMSQAGIPNSPFLVYRKEEMDQISYEKATAKLKLPLFVKPAKLGSSVGISKVTDSASFEKAIRLAFEYDTKILIEEGIKGREIECAVLGNEYPEASVIGEIVPPDGFYDYEAKYVDADGAKLLLPAPDLDEATIKRVQEMAVRTFKILECEGLSRVDFFLCEDGSLLVNEVNTLPGFTKISMYPGLWGLSGIPYTELITRLIDLAIDKKSQERKLKTIMVF